MNDHNTNTLRASPTLIERVYMVFIPNFCLAPRLFLVYSKLIYFCCVNNIYIFYQSALLIMPAKKADIYLDPVTKTIMYSYQIVFRKKNSSVLSVFIQFSY